MEKIEDFSERSRSSFCVPVRARHLWLHRHFRRLKCISELLHIRPFWHMERKWVIRGYLAGTGMGKIWLLADRNI